MHWLRRLVQPPQNPDAKAFEAVMELPQLREAIGSLIAKYAALNGRLEALEHAQATRSAETLEAVHRLDHLHKSLLGRIARQQQLCDSRDEDSDARPSSVLAIKRQLGR